ARLGRSLALPDVRMGASCKRQSPWSGCSDAASQTCATAEGSSMAIRATCEDCFLEYTVADDKAGRSFKCKECGGAVRVPRSGGASTAPRRAAAPPPPQRRPSGGG